MLIEKDLINPQVPTDLPAWPDDPMLQDPRRIVETKPPDVLQDSRAVHLRDEWPGKIDRSARHVPLPKYRQ